MVFPIARNAADKSPTGGRSAGRAAFDHANGNGLLSGLVKLACLAVLGLFLLGLVGSMMNPRHDGPPGPDPSPAIAPTLISPMTRPVPMAASAGWRCPVRPDGR